jgi:N4-gp56 family major capsid protein
LQNNNADFATSLKDGEMKIGTAPVLDAYFAMGHSNLITELRNVNGFIEKAQYPNQQGVSSAEWGTVGNIRFMLSSRGSITTNASLLGANIYNMFVTGLDAYAIIEQTSQSAQFIYHPMGWGDDPKLFNCNSLCGIEKSSLIDLEAAA